MKNESAYSRAIFETQQVSFPEEFAIITAYNPDGIGHTVEENEALNRLLKREIYHRHHSNCCLFEITGKSACGSHKEPGWGISCSLEEAIDLGGLFRQEAIFWINTDNSLHLVDVKTREQTCIGKFDVLCWMDQPLHSMSHSMQEKLADLIHSEELTLGKERHYQDFSVLDLKKSKTEASPRFHLQKVVEWSNENLYGSNYVMSDLNHDQHLSLYNLNGEWCTEGTLDNASPVVVWQAALDFILLGIGKLNWKLVLADQSKAIEELQSIDIESLFELDSLRFTNCSEVRAYIDMFAELTTQSRGNKKDENNRIIAANWIKFL